MSFSGNVKTEISNHEASARHCRLAEIAAIINSIGKIEYDLEQNRYNIHINTENTLVGKKFFTLVEKTFNINIHKHRSDQREMTELTIEGRLAVEKVLQGCKLLESGMISHRINPLVVAGTCCKRAYLRGVFLSLGSISDPTKTYHLELVNHHHRHSQEVTKLMESFDLQGKQIQRKNQYIVYLKEGEQIANFLKVIEAPISLMEFENLRIVKFMRNRVNRIVNCETANIKKTVKAAYSQRKNIEYILEQGGIGSLPENLRELAQLRLENEQTSLKELGQMLDPPVGKSGVNHRLRRINQIAEELRNKNGVN